MFILGFKSYVAITMYSLILSQIRKKDLIEIFEKNYHKISPLWSNHQLEWINGVYGAYKDHDKYIIVIHLIKKTFDFYTKNFVKETFVEFFEKEFIEIEAFNVIEVSRALNIPKESARRKIIELEKSGAIKRVGKRIIIDKSAFAFIKPEKSIIRISRFLSTISTILYNEKVITNQFDSTQIKGFIENNFSLIWKLYYEVQIPMLLNWKKVFKDIETFHIWAVCVVNQKLNSQREKNDKMIKKVFIKKYFFNHDDVEDGINAMSISDISGIPRATVIRKLNTLIKQNYLNINNNKLYYLAAKHEKELTLRQKINFNNLSEFIKRIFNLMLVEQKQLKKRNEKLPYGAQKYLNPL